MKGEFVPKELALGVYDLYQRYNDKRKNLCYSEYSNERWAGCPERISAMRTAGFATNLYYYSEVQDYRLHSIYADRGLIVLHSYKISDRAKSCVRIE